MAKQQSLAWAWRPDSKTETALSRGRRKLKDKPLGIDRPHEGGTINPEGETTMATKKTATKKTATKKTSTKKAPAKKSQANGSSDRIPLKRICQELDMEPRVARRKLRNAELNFHDHRERWTFTQAQAKKVREVLKAA